MYSQSKQKENRLALDIKTEIDRLYPYFSGSIYVQNKDYKIFEQHFGYADSINLIPNNKNTQYGLASLSKTFTMLAILSLKEQEKISLNDSLSSYFKEFTDPRAKNITIKQLLAHTSGWGHYWENPDYIENRHEFESHADFLSFIKKTPLSFDPGIEYKYSNIGYIILGAIIEKVSGISYEGFVQSNVFEKIEMKYSSIKKNEKYNYAKPYSRSNENIASTNRSWADGGAHASVGDISKLIHSVFVTKDFCSEISVNQLLDGFNEEDDGIFEITGGFNGNSTALLYHEPTGYFFSVLSNLDPPISEDLSRTLISVIMEYESSRKTIQITGNTYNKSTGAKIAYTNIGIFNSGISSASDKNGQYKLEIPAAYFNDSLIFSAIGYKRVNIPIKKLANGQNFDVPLQPVLYTLDEVVLSNEKPKKRILGTRNVSPLASGVYIGGGKPGASLVTYIEVSDSVAYLNKVKLHIRGNKKTKAFKLRLRILKNNNGEPGEDLLQKSIVMTSRIKKGWIVFDLKDDILKLSESVFVGIEWVEEPENKITARNAYPRISYVTSKNTASFARTTSFNFWKSISIKPIINLEVEF
ncbi:serine hydrolase [uncultured Winogradskyella sp.]|uniref:serine hydrolase n=1 Tax=uncultured Winogradskyella sp. TaxID=395353 RepID=UPI002601BB8E|nr:serine hydrolase [uncultured Winogradskyella sp.]